MKRINYKTITEGKDWGPAITKIILYFESEIEKESLSKDIFNVYSNRIFKKNDTESQHKVQRTVVDCYISESGREIIIEFLIGPTLQEGSPYNYDLESGFNRIVTTKYQLTTKKPIFFKNGKSVSINNNLKNIGNINLIADDFINNRLFSYQNIELGYATFTPKSPKKSATPLIIWLHGAGEGGKDTTIALLGNKVVNLATSDIQSFFGVTGAYVLVPQSPTIWMDIDGNKNYNIHKKGNMGTSYYTSALMELIKSYVESEKNIDTNRIYIGGCSNGGFMTINLLATYPNFFAAAYPIATPYLSEWITDEKLNNIKSTPIWFTHAKTDETVPIYQGEISKINHFEYVLTLDKDGNEIPINNHTNILFKKLKEVGSTNLHYTLLNKVEDTTVTYYKDDGVTPYEYMGHFSWINSLNNECRKIIDGKNISLFQWLSDQKKLKC